MGPKGGLDAMAKEKSLPRPGNRLMVTEEATFSHCTDWEASDYWLLKKDAAA
jgi:hypothetical protein